MTRRTAPPSRRGRSFLRLRRALLAGSLLISLAVPRGSASAAPPVDPATRATARTLAEEGLAHFDAANYKEALERFDRAESLVHAPTMGLMAARCLDKLGLLVEASERYLTVSKTALEAGASQGFRDAVADAAHDYKAILPRIPKLGIGLEGASVDDADVTLDGRVVPAAMIGIRRVVDPGRHRIEAKRDAELVAKEIDLKEGDLVDVTLTFAPEKAGPTPGPTAAKARPRPEKAVKEAPPKSSGSGQRIGAYAALGVGGAGFVMGIVTLAMEASAKSSLSAAGCNAQLQCPAAIDHGPFDRYNGMRALPAVGFAIGAVGIGAGVALLLTAPKPQADEPKPATALALEPFFTAGGAGLRGAF